MVREEIDLTLSENEDSNDVAQPQPAMPVKCESRVQPLAAASTSNNGDDGGGVEEGLKPATTGGKGLWSLWTRNFQSTLLMLMDLIDNSVDAAMPRGHIDFTGRVQIYRDLYEVMPEQTYNTGLCIRNNSPNKITPLKDALKLFISSKENSGSDSIGENGVGLKQSCAALSDLSFVLVKNGVNKFELGILAKALQKDDGFYLPCFEFDEGDGRTVGQQMMDIFCKSIYKEVADCIAEYGKVRSGGNPSLARGIARLSQHFSDMNNKFFDCPYVFEVIIDKVIHHGNFETTGAQGKNMAVSDIIKQLQHEVPRRYLHIQDESFKFSVGKKQLSFKYWPERLVEFTKIEIPARSKTPWRDDFGENTPDSYNLRIFLGFDRYRIADPASGMKSKKACSLYIYSRSSGRMIQYEPDARNMLSLNSGGTEYCQALTVIIDDIGGHLPLDPTKQGIAFGNQAYGNVHKENLYAVVSGLVKFYYQYHKSKFGGKKMLSAKITDFVDSELPDNVKTCSNSDLTDYALCFNLTKDDRILVDRTCHEEEIIGPDTMFRLLPENSGKAAKAKDSKPTHSPVRKRQQAANISKTPPKKKQPTAKAGALPAKKKCKPAAKRKQKTATKKKQQKAKASKPTPKGKQKTAKINKPRDLKKQSVAKANALRPKMKGTRSSSRSSTRPKRFGRDSDLESGTDDPEDTSTDDTEDTSTDDPEDTSKHDEDPIDLCSSSDEEDEDGEITKEAEEDNVKREDEAMTEDDPVLDEAMVEDDPVLDEAMIEDDPVLEEAMIEDDPVPGNVSPISLANDDVLPFLSANEPEENPLTDATIKEDPVPGYDLPISPANDSVLPNVSVNETEENDLAEEVDTDMDTLKTENAGLVSENTDLKNRVSALETENDSLEKEIKALRNELTLRSLNENATSLSSV